MARTAREPSDERKPIVLVTGVSGNVGTALAAALTSDYRVVGMDMSEPRGVTGDGTDWIRLDLTSDASVCCMS